MLEWGRAIVPSWLSNKLTKEKKRKKRKKEEEEASFLWDSQKINKYKRSLISAYNCVTNANPLKSNIKKFRS